MGPATEAGAQRDGRVILVLVGLTALGAILRVGEVGQSLYGDELWAYAGATAGGAGDVLDFVRSDQEISPPLFTLLAWLAAKLGDPENLIRIPSLAAGIAVIPLIWFLGLRTVGPRAALVAAALAALSPFLAFYAVEARAYSLAIALTVASTLLMLIALERHSTRWWVAYGLLACLAMYTHYTVAFVLLAQLIWLLWRHPGARVPALIANVAAALAYVPWIPSLLDDVSSPSQDIIGSLAPFTLDSFAGFTASWSIGHPAKGLAGFWGAGLEIALLAGIALGVVGAAISFRDRADTGEREASEVPAAASRDSLLLVAMLALACPAGSALVSLIGSDQYLPRNLAASWPYLALGLAAILTAGPRAIRVVATVTVVAAFAVGAIRTTEPGWGRPDIGGAAAFIEANTGPGDVVLDTLAPGGGADLPVGRTLDLEFDEPFTKISVAGPADVTAGVERAAGARIAIVGPALLVAGAAQSPELAGSSPALSRTFEGTLPTEVLIYDIPARPHD